MNNEPITILLVEDNPADVFLLRDGLERAQVSCELIVLSDGEMALQFFRRQGKYLASPMPDLAVMDARLPVHDGIEVLKALRQSKHFAKLPVVMSSSVDPNQRVEMEQLGVLRYFEKPSDLEGFFQMALVLKEILLEHAESPLAVGAS